MKNQFNNLPSESEISALAQVSPAEGYDDTRDESGFERELRQEAAQEMREEEFHASAESEDDFADFNDNETHDYRDEGGAEDAYLDSTYEDRFDGCE